jgi:hypothetical protein
LILFKTLVYFVDPLLWLIFLEFTFIDKGREINGDGSDSSLVESSVVLESVQVLVKRKILMVQACK